MTSSFPKRTPEEHKLVLRLRAMLSQYEETRDLRMIGGYKPGADPEMDKAMEIVPRLYQALIQKQDDPASRDAFREVASALAQTGGAG